MQPGNHTFEELFQQLGLPSTPAQIEKFVQMHSPVQKHVALPFAHFWNEGQAEFIKEAISEDSEWSELVDQLDALLRH